MAWLLVGIVWMGVVLILGIGAYAVHRWPGWFDRRADWISENGSRPIR